MSCLNRPQIPPGNAGWLLLRKLLRFLILELSALLGSIFLIGMIAVITATVAGYVYDINHVIPDPVMRGGDIGSGLIMVLAIF
ncbi:MAG: hypothetical protein JNIBNLAF_01277 [Nitrosomonas europaea]|uniref:hypothetical protein n=1 Tax=Nitrosomonas europaea TaxID=915 RepID=UPI0023F40C2B|nr:hypothetical protein [Nitrosomonas europaea]MBV6389630.1 hypothetical protein [Nitrosomonas europaea]